MIRRAHGLLLGLFRRMPRRGRIWVVHLLTPSYSVGAMSFIERDDGRLLLVRHSYRSRWGVPGGLLKRGEEPTTAARREAREEVGLDIELVGEPAIVVDPGPRRIDVVYRARPLAGARAEGLQPCSPEIVEIGWFDRADLPELQFETSGALVALARASRSPSAPVLAPTDAKPSSGRG